MNKLNLTSIDWCDLVFDRKNKKYGGYLLRTQSSRRHTRATLIVVAIAILAFSVPMLLKVVLPKQEVLKMTEVTTLSSLPMAEEEKKVEQPQLQELPPPPALKSTIKFTPPVIKKDAEVHDEEEIKAQQDLNTAKASISIADVKGTDEEHGVDIAEVKEVTSEAPVEEKPYQMVEQMPTFPGGESELMAFLRQNLKYPAIAQENGVQGRVVIRFVVSALGKIENVEVLRGFDPSCDREAIRLIKSMPNWIAGKQNGKSVPVYFTIPIVFRLQ